MTIRVSRIKCHHDYLLPWVNTLPTLIPSNPQLPSGTSTTYSERPPSVFMPHGPPSSNLLPRPPTITSLLLPNDRGIRKPHSDVSFHPSPLQWVSHYPGQLKVGRLWTRDSVTFLSNTRHRIPALHLRVRVICRCVASQDWKDFPKTGTMGFQPCPSHLFFFFFEVW